MSRRGARLTQSEYHRIFKAAEKAGVNARIELPDGTVITTMGKATDKGDDANADDLDTTEKISELIRNAS